MVCNKENLVLSNSTPDFHSRQKKTAINGVQCEKQFMQAYGKAGRFLEGAANFYGENDQQMTAFMLQQGVGVIITLLGNCSKTHSFLKN